MTITNLGIPLNAGTSSLSNQVSIASGSCVIPGSERLVIVVVHQRAAAALGTDALPTVKDEANNVIERSVGAGPDVLIATGETRTAIFSTYYISGATHTYTASWTSATANVNDTRIEVFAVSNVAYPNWLDVIGTQGNSSAVQSTTATGSIAQADSLAVWAATYFNASATGAAPTNYTDRVNVRDNTRGAVFHVADHTPLTFPGSEQAVYTPAGASGNNHSTVLAVYKGGAGSGGPANTVAPAITGTPTQGSTLSTTNGTWTNSPSSYAYQWQRDTASNGIFSNIGSATANTYLLVQADIGNQLRCVVTATNGSGSVPANSNTVGPVGALFTITVSGPLEVCGNAAMVYNPPLGSPPTDIALSNSSILENQSIGTAVGTFSTTDPDVGDTFTYSLVAGTGSTDNGSFAVVGNTLKSARSFDYETKASYFIRVRSMDQQTLFFEKQFTITITNVNEPPTDITLSNQTIMEKQPIGTLVGSFSSIDPDVGDTFTYTLVSGTGSTDNAMFSIVGGDLKSTTSFNYAAKNSYSIRIRSTDAGGLYFEKQFTILVMVGIGSAIQFFAQTPTGGLLPIVGEQFYFSASTNFLETLPPNVWNGGTHLSDGRARVELGACNAKAGHINNTRWSTDSSVSLNGGAEINLTALTKANAPLWIRFSHFTPVKTQNARFWVYDPLRTDRDPVLNATIRAYEITDIPSSLWQDCNGISAALSLADQATYSLSHDFYIAMSFMTSTVIPKSLKIKMELNYY